MSNHNDWARLAEVAKARRIHLGLTQVELASKAPLSIDRIQAIEGNRTTRYSPRTLAALERGLDWAAGSVAKVLAGQDPTSVRGASAYDNLTLTDSAQASVFHAGDLSPAQAEVDFGIGDTPPYPNPRDETELEANETWQAAKNLEAVMCRQRKRHQRRDLGDTG